MASKGSLLYSMAKETYQRGKIDLLGGQKRPASQGKRDGYMASKTRARFHTRIYMRTEKSESVDDSGWQAGGKRGRGDRHGDR